MQGDQLYCLSASVSHISCQLAAVEPPNHCWLRSDPVWVAAIPPIGRIISVCRSHLACAWLYIAVSGSLLLLLSFLLAILWFGETADPVKSVGFAFVWAGLLVSLLPLLLILAFCVALSVGR